MPVHRRLDKNEEQHTIFVTIDACSKGDDTRDTQLLHKARTNARAVVLYSHNLGMVMLIGTSSDNIYVCGNTGR